MGSVFRARQDDLGRAVAVKTLHPDLTSNEPVREQFTHEAHILAQLDDPGIVPVHYAGQTEDGPYYVMRLVEGTSVDRHLAGASYADVAAVFRDIAAALGAAHREGVLHRDVKPANILVEASGRPILVDFGLSTRTVQGRSSAGSERLVGTPDFLAPEVLAGAGYSPASDIYALGATLYLVLAGRPAFPAHDLADKLRAIREDDLLPPRALEPGVPKPLQAICLKAMERSPDDRYSSADQLRRDLERFLAGDPVESLPVRSRSLLRRKIERHLADHLEWEEQGVLDERQRLALQLAYERLDEEQRSLARGAFRSVPSLLFLTGLVLTVFGPLILQAVAWDGLGPIGRPALPGVPLVLLAGLGLRRWEAQDRRRGLACLIGAALLAVPAAFGLVDLVPALRTVVDDQGVVHQVVPGPLWLPGEDAAEWIQAGARLLEWKVLATSVLALAVVAVLYRLTRSALFLWLGGLAVAGAAVPAAQLAGWDGMPLAVRWVLGGSGSLAVMAAGLPLDRSWQRDRALPFYGLGFLWALWTVLEFASEGMPVALFGRAEGFDAPAACFALHGLGFVAGGLALHHRGTALLRQAAGVVLLVAFLMVHVGLIGLAREGGWWWELALVGDCAGFLLLGLALHRNTLVLSAAIALPFAVGSVSQRHMDALWAWSGTIVLSGATLVLLALRLSAREAGGAASRAGHEVAEKAQGATAGPSAGPRR